jgi:hypothetical protein
MMKKKMVMITTSIEEEEVLVIVNIMTMSMFKIWENMTNKNFSQ